jgi:hypothetical protein
MLIKLRKAQNTAEYAIVLGLIVGAVIAMQVYVKRNMQGRIKQLTDYNAQEVTQNWSASVDFGKQYEPYYLKSDFTVTRDSSDRIDTDADAVDSVFTKKVSNDTTTRAKDGFQEYGYDDTEDYILDE